jgi:selenoprotein W-related protein
MAELLRDLETEIERIALVPTDGGRFEVMVGDQLVYSKLQTGRHAEAGEVLKLVRASLRGRLR